MMSENLDRRSPTPPPGQRHLFAVCRFDGHVEGANPSEAFLLTRSYWSEDEAIRKREELNDQVADDATVYFVRPVRVAEYD